MLQLENNQQQGIFQEKHLQQFVKNYNFII